jgi:hypothetical protein
VPGRGKRANLGKTKGLRDGESIKKRELRCNPHISPELAMHVAMANFRCAPSAMRDSRVACGKLLGQSQRKGFFPSRPTMRILYHRKKTEGKVGWILLWLIGVPVPILLILFLLRGCT